MIQHYIVDTVFGTYALWIKWEGECIKYICIKCLKQPTILEKFN